MALTVKLREQTLIKKNAPKQSFGYHQGRTTEGSIGEIQWSFPEATWRKTPKLNPEE
jgi:hypothetical protein